MPIKKASPKHRIFEERKRVFLLNFADEAPQIRDSIVKDLPAYNALLSLKAQSFEEFALQCIASERGETYDADNPPVPDCPNCNSNKRVGTKGKHLYRCTACNQSFSANYNSISSGTKCDALTWMKMLHCLLESKGIAKTCEYCDIAPETYYHLRNRLFYAMQLLLKDVKLYGIVQVDNTFCRISYKGVNLKESEFDEDSIFFDPTFKPRTARKRGAGYQYREKNANSICIFNPITQLVFGYNAYKVLNKITNGYDSSDYVEFFYSATYDGGSDKYGYGYLRQIQYSSGEYCVYNYNADGTLASAVDFDNGYRVLYSYTSELGNKRVASITEAVGGTQGQAIGFAYKDKYFSVRSSGNDDIYGNSDDLYTVTLFDNFGRAICSYTEDNYGNVYGASYAKYKQNDVGKKTNNKLTVSSVKGITAENLVKNGGCETVSNWTTGYSGSGYSAVANTAEKLNGTYSIKLAHTDNTGYVYKYQNVTIPNPGTYTLSAYVKTSGVTSETGGACIQISSSKSEYITGTTDTSVQNGWRRISVTRTFDTAATFSVFLRLDSATGTAYFDNVQLERADIESDYNFIQNGSFRTSSDWSGTFSKLDTEASRGHVGSVTGSAESTNIVYQTIPLNVPANTTFMVSGWARANSVRLTDTRRFGLSVILTYSDNTTEEHYESFNPENIGWQYLTAAVVPKKDLTVTSAKVAFVYDYNCNTVYFDDISFTIEPAQTYAYDDNGNLESATDIYGQNDTALYDGVDLKSYESINNGDFEYTYHNVNGINTHDVKKIDRSLNGVTQTLTYSYNDFGNVIGSVLSNSETDEEITSSAVYGEYGNFLTSSTNSLGSTTNYNYDSVTKLLAYIQDANGNRTAYIYDNRDRVTTVYLDADKDSVADTTESSVAYLYASGRLYGINTATTAYTITYDTFGNMVSVSAGSNVLATYTYKAGNGKLTRMTYGNGEYEDYTYDNLDRLVKVTYNGNSVNDYIIVYDSNGRLAKAVDGKVDITYLYEYDSLDRLIRAYQKDASGNTVYAVENSYDEYGRATGSTYVIDGTEYTYGISYKENTNLVSQHTNPGNTVNYTYDSFDRITNASGTPYSVSYTYVPCTTLVSSYTITTAKNSIITYSYSYDSLGNIVSISRNGTLFASYEYDSLGQLIRENNVLENVTYIMSYDMSGNILSKRTYELSDDTTDNLLNTSASVIDYTYSDTAWGDLLTKSANTSITYDAIGNPVTNGNWVYSWDGRTLKAMDFPYGGGYAFEAEFTYNSDGIRTRKVITDAYTDENYTVKYVLDGNKILRETHIDNTTNTVIRTLDFFYDDAGVAGFILNGIPYYYIKNIQGDVIHICSSSGGTVATYVYDAWGNILSSTGVLSKYNPFRYRCYYYDSETGLYYLNSRYYDPQVGRFINADGIIGANGGVQGYNMFAYCNNSPVIFTDPSGYYLMCVSGFDANSSQHLLMRDYGGLHSGSGGGGGGAYIHYSELISSKVKEDIENFNKSNDNPSVVFGSNYFSYYNGVLVVKTPLDASFSFGFIGLSSQQQTLNTLNHEHGHTTQMDNMGVIDYTLYVAIPSVTINLLHRREILPYDYFSYPFEAEADKFGGVTRVLNNPIPEGEYNYWSLFVLLAGDISKDVLSKSTDRFGPIRRIY